MQYRGLVALPEHNAINVDVISPATDKHVSKHSAQAFRLVHESPELYASATRPFIDALPPARLAWVVNILDKKARVPYCHMPLSDGLCKPSCIRHMHHQVAERCACHTEPGALHVEQHDPC